MTTPPVNSETTGLEHPSAACQEPTQRCDILIVGAGPAGLAAAVAAAASGQRIVLIDDNPAPGGQIWREGPGHAQPPVAKALRQTLARSANVRLCAGTRVVAAPQPDQLLLEDDRLGWRLQWGRLILCTGARELLLPFPDWTLPGVTGAGALQALIKGGMPVRGQRILVAGSGPLLLASADAARRAGAKVVMVAEQASWSSLLWFATQLARRPAKAAQAALLFDRHYRGNARIVAALGTQQVEAAQIRQGSRISQIACERIACGFGMVPNTELGQLLGCALTVPNTRGQPAALAIDERQRSSIADIFAAGECTGIGGSERALAQGEIAGTAAVAEAPIAQRALRERSRWNRFSQCLDQSFALRDDLRQLPDAATLVCRCEDVDHATLRDCADWSEAKLQHRCGMGACQGRICGAACRFIYSWGPSTPKPPLVPARLDTLAVDAPQD